MVVAESSDIGGKRTKEGKTIKSVSFSKNYFLEAHLMGRVSSCLFCENVERG